MLEHDRSTNFFSKTNFRIGTEHLILFGRHGFTDVFWFSKLFALLNYLCVFSTSLTVQCQTPLEIRQNILGYCYICIGFELCLRSIVGLPGSCACLLRSALFGQVCEGRTTAIVLPASMVKAPQWRNLKTDCHNARKLVNGPMTVSNYKIDGGHLVLNDGPFITLVEVLTA